MSVDVIARARWASLPSTIVDGSMSVDETRRDSVGLRGLDDRA